MKYRRITKIKSLFTGLVNRDRKGDSMDTPNLQPVMNKNLLEYLRYVKLYNRPGVHTFSITVRVSKGAFIKFFAKVKFLVERLSKYNGYYKILHDTQFGNKIIPNKYVKGGEIFNRVYIENGIGSELSFHDDIGFIKLIINPTLVVASKQPGFSKSKYNYMQIAHDYDTDWRLFSEILDDFFEKWEIPECRHQESSLRRIDVCMDIDMANLDIAKYIYHLRMVPKNALCYKDFKFDPEEASKHLVIYNRNRAFSVYDKVCEQFENYKVVYDGNIMRLKYHFLNPKSSNLIRNLDDVFHIHCTSFTKIVETVTTLAPIIIRSSFDDAFQSGDFVKESYGLFYLLGNPERRVSQIKRIIRSNNQFRGIETYEDIERKCNEMRNENLNRYYRMRRYMQDAYNIAPLWLNEDVEHTFSLPSLPHLIDYVMSKDEWSRNQIESLWNFRDYL